MKKKTINAVISKKFDEWLASIDDEEVKKLVDKNTVITGGSIASMINNEKVNDYDVYFTNKETVLKVAKYYIDKFKAMKPNAPEIELYTSDDFADPDSKISQWYKEQKAIPEGSETKPDVVLCDFYEMCSRSKEEGRVFIYIGGARNIASEKEIDLDDCENPLDDEVEDKTDETKPKYRPVFFLPTLLRLQIRYRLLRGFTVTRHRYTAISIIFTPRITGRARIGK